MPPSIAYAQAVSILKDPGEYAGKTMRIAGVFNYSKERGCGVIIVTDSTGCCEAGMDFVCPEGSEYPADYPSLYSRIQLVARFEDSGNDDTKAPEYLLTDAILETP